MKGKHFIISNPVFPFDLLVSYDESDVQFSHIMKKYGIPIEEYERLLNMSDTTHGMCALLQSNQTVIRLRKLSSKYLQYKALSHEVFHAVSFIMEEMRVQLRNYVSDEAYAYLIGFYTAEICTRLKL